MKCPLCAARKGKRSCPGKDSLICAQCCGTKRILEIDCPQDCPYLKTGRGHDAALEHARHLLRHPDRQQRWARVLRDFLPVVTRLEAVLAEARRSSRELSDREAADALDLLISSYQTELKGILYQRTSENLKVDSLRSRLREESEAMRAPASAETQAVRLSDLVESLEFIRDMLASHMNSRDARTSYVDFLARIMPRAKDLTPSSRPLIIPG